MKVSAILIALYAGSLALEIGLTYALRRDFTPANLEVDEREYYDLSGQLVKGHYEIEPRRTIGFVVLLAGLRAVGASRLLTLHFGVAAVFALVAPLTYLLAQRETGSRRAALLAGLGVMFWPPFVWFGASLYSESAALPLFAAFLLAVPAARGSGAVRGRRWLGAGVLLGLCMHFRPMYLVFSPFAALIAYWRSPKGLRGLLSCVALTIGCSAVVLPWSVAASIHEGRFVLLSTIGGEVFGGAMNPELLRADRNSGEFYTTPAMRSTWVGPGKWLPIHKTGLLSREELVSPYSVKTDALAAHSLAWARQNPGKAFYITVRKLTYMWGIYPFWGRRIETLLGNIPAVGLLLLGLVSLVVYRRDLVELSILWAPAVFVTLLAIVSWGSWRFRQPGDLGLIVLVASLPFATPVNFYLASVKDENRSREPLSSENLGRAITAKSSIKPSHGVGLSLENA
jgi:hypothetical protein